MARRRFDRAAQNAFEAPRAIALSFGGVDAGTRYDGAPVLRARGRFMAAIAAHPSAEPDSLVVRFDPAEREHLLEDAPDVYYVTDHYRPYPVVLVRLRRIDRDALRDLLSIAWRLTTSPRPELDGPTSSRRRRPRTVHG